MKRETPFIVAVRRQYDAKSVGSAFRPAVCLLLATGTLLLVSNCGGDEPAAAGSRRDAGGDVSMENPIDAGVEVAAPNPADTGEAASPFRTRAGAVALTTDDGVAVALNRATGVATVLSIEAAGRPPLRPVRRISLGGEPWAVVIGPDDTTAFVVLRRDGELVRIKDLKLNPHEEGRVKTGSEPTGLAISATGSELYVANWAEGTVSVFQTSDLSRTRDINLNKTLADSKVLGDVAERPGLAHPRSVTLSDDGKKLYVTEFFSQPRAGSQRLQPYEFDVSRQGLVYTVGTELNAVAKLIYLAPIEDTGFRDSNGCQTGCFPNQLFAAEFHQGRLYVPAVCASPVGPIGIADPADSGAPERCSPAAVSRTANFRTLVHSTIFVIDATTDTELVNERVLLPKAFESFYQEAGATGLTPIPLTPVDFVFRNGTREAYVVAQGSDGVFRVRYAANGALAEVGSPQERFINLYPPGAIFKEGKLPTGAAVSHHNPAFALVVNEVSGNVSFVDLDTQRVTDSVGITTDRSDTEKSIANGQWAFSTGRERWSYEGRAWSSCASCHVEGLSDGVTWFFGRGPRQTPALDGSHDQATGLRRVLNWTAVFDEVHDLEIITRSVMGGVGGIVWQEDASAGSTGDRITFDDSDATARRTSTPQNGLNGSTASLMAASPAASCAPGAGPCNSVTNEWNDIERFVSQIRSFNAPRFLADRAGADTDIAAGRQLFVRGRCAACHGGTLFSVSRLFYTPGEANNHPVSGLLRSTRYWLPDAGFPRGLNPPAAAEGGAPLRYTGPSPQNDDQINCVLRHVGTFSTSNLPFGIAPDGGSAVLETRQNMIGTAQGETGFNPPSLLGVAAGAPYFHAGNARTLEELFDPTFEPHHQALAPGFLSDPTKRAEEIRQLVTFLLSIDGSAVPLPVPGVSDLGYDPDLCAATPPGVIR